MLNPPHPLKFLCDEMLRGVARWLRAAGYDTAVAGAGEGDGALLTRAVAERRLLLTRDRKMAERKGSDGVVVTLACNDTGACIEELGRRIALNWLHAPFTRCLVCNSPLIEAPEDAHGRVPRNAAGPHDPLYYCAVCDRVYWEGGHVRRMRERLERWERGLTG